MAGFVYVMSNPGFDGRVKIGKSIKDPTMDRVEELNSTTSVPEPFKVEYYCYVDKFDQLEARVHKLLDHNRPNKRREFFQIDLLKAVTTIQGIAHELGGIKFEEFYFDQNIFLEPTADAEKASRGTEHIHSEEDIAAQYPKAAKVLEYNTTAKAYFDKLTAVPGNVTKDFLLVLENDPNISAQALDELFDEPAYKKHFKPFDDLFANYFYDICLQENMSMAQEFQNDFELLKSSVTAKEVFRKLCNKYRVKVEKYDVKGQLFFNAVVSSISSLDGVTVKELQALFSEIGLELNSTQYFYEISHAGALEARFSKDNLLIGIKEKILSGGFINDEAKAARLRQQTLVAERAERAMARKAGFAERAEAAKAAVAKKDVSFGFKAAIFIIAIFIVAILFS